MVIHREAVITRAAAEVSTRAPAGATTSAGRERVARPAIWSGGQVGELIAGHVDALHVTHSTIANPQSVEFAARMTHRTSRGVWRLSWL
uniref:hypothetical protein n=1 Tax=Nocardia pseudovaccinii TaxID=189540 RepID=UPI000A79994A